MLGLKEFSMAELNILEQFYAPSEVKRRHDGMAKLIGYLQSGLHLLLRHKEDRLGNTSTFECPEESVSRVQREEEGTAIIGILTILRAIFDSLCTAGHRGIPWVRS